MEFVVRRESSGILYLRLIDDTRISMYSKISVPLLCICT